MGNVKVIPRSLTEAYKRREGDFSPNLVGLQFTNGESLFTFGNFQITTNLSSREAKDFILGGQWSEYYSLNNLNLTQESSEILVSNDVNLKLNFNPKNISRYVYFGSFYELIRVTLEEIIQKWKGSLYVNPFNNTNTVLNTILSFSYDNGQNVSSFLIPSEAIDNKFELIINSEEVDNFTDGLYNINNYYQNYVIWNKESDIKVPIIGFTGLTTDFPYLKVITKGNPFPLLTASTFAQTTYHVMPVDNEINLFFKELTDFQKVLLNNLTSPKYTSEFKVPLEIDGNIIYYDKSYTWPTTDGYNIDINNYAYRKYVEDILSMADSFDTYKTDLVSRRFVSETIQEYDTDGDGSEVYGRKVKKLLRIYGREFDEVKKYIDGISFANVVTYDKLDNTSDNLIKTIAKNFGFDFFLTTTNDNFDLLSQLESSSQPVFSGYSRNLSAKELETELWRRLIINAWWLFKSKGTRKVIEFFFKLFKIPECLVSLDEYVYLAKDRLDPRDVLLEIAKITDIDIDTLSIEDLPIDIFGFPKKFPNRQDNYFQMSGYWYNGGNESTEGNNPHVGPYDFGNSYINQYRCFSPNYNSYITGGTLIDVYKNSFNTYNKGTFIFDQNGLPVPYYDYAYANFLNQNNLVKNITISKAGLTYVGGSNSALYQTPSGDTYSMKISFITAPKNVTSTNIYTKSLYE